MPTEPLPRICNFTTEETLAEELLIDFISFQKYSSQPRKNCHECNRHECNYRLSFKNFLPVCQAFPVWTSVCGKELSQVGIGSAAIGAIISCELWRNFGVF